ncbi:hypothetical protein EBE87_14795 [Pseudoroseomonas wenyumeiae]|uniref:EthD domain-containing protein n=1 Tax=Teichococcus wenyumeiae TaxID=2478470 RepID=A0A3A9JXL4_9PROT|nr:hypothetical protein [Pseudoroseomonas wenyumeiae]RKK05548.1 hypothetical protein D6Z83_03860 [Pseudoroseomonas wenyumeiae]RMI20722.1 hypothetical protein EBE87_14795 [Pseudoroseomonas wenyumeiae]
MAESIFYVVEVSLPDKDLPEFAEWYATVHAPHLFQAGFNNCTSYLAVSGGMSVVDIYQADDWSMFEAPAFERYRGIVFTEPYRPKVLAEVENTRTVYVHHARTPLPSRAPDAPLDADWITIWRFAGDEGSEARLAAWLEESGAAALGAAQVRLLHRGKDAPTGTSFRPPLALVLEWPDRPPEEQALLNALPDWLRADIDTAQGFTGCRLYPWANNPALKAEVARRVAAAGR